MEARLLESVFPTDTNPQGNLFGGTLVSWMDKAAGFAAMRRARSSVVTAAIEDIAFQVPILQGDLVEITATVISVGRTSMRVRVEVQGVAFSTLSSTLSAIADHWRYSERKALVHNKLVNDTMRWQRSNADLARRHSSGLIPT